MDLEHKRASKEGGARIYFAEEWRWAWGETNFARKKKEERGNLLVWMSWREKQGCNFSSSILMLLVAIAGKEAMQKNREEEYESLQ